MAEPEISIRITLSEFVVLDEILRRFSQTDHFTIEDKSELQALWNLQCVLEKEPADERRLPSLAEAKANLRSDD